jgi:hypothetical protein
MTRSGVILTGRPYDRSRWFFRIANPSPVLAASRGGRCLCGLCL